MSENDGNTRALSRAKTVLRYNVLLVRSENGEGFYTVTVPALPGCVTQGLTKKEALLRAKEAIEGYLESLHKDGLPIPEDVELAEVNISR